MSQEKKKGRVTKEDWEGMSDEEMGDYLLERREREDVEIKSQSAADGKSKVGKVKTNTYYAMFVGGVQVAGWKIDRSEVEKDGNDFLDGIVAKKKEEGPSA